MTFVYFTDGDVDAEALVDFLAAHFRVENDANCEDVIDFVEGDILVLHLIPNGIRAFHACFDFVVNPHLVQSFADGFGEFGE